MDVFFGFKNFNDKLTGSKTTQSSLNEDPGTIPAPPTKPDARLSMILPYKFGITKISN